MGARHRWILQDPSFSNISQKIYCSNISQKVNLLLLITVPDANYVITQGTGRLGIFEVLEVSQEIRKLIAEKSDAEVINKQAIKEGMQSMLDDALIKVQKGSTTIEEVIRVTKAESL